jgi:type I restriction-modification system DNA methylase subunit
MAGRPDATITPSQIAELAGVSPSAVSNWRRRFDDFPHPVETAAGGRDLFPLTQIEDWLRSHKRLDPDRANERLLFEAMNLIRGRSAADEGLEILATAISLVEAGDRAGHRDQHATASDVARLVEEHDPSLAGVFAPLESLDAAVAQQVLEIADRIDSADRQDVFEWVLQRRKRFVETRTSDQLVSLVVQLTNGASSVLDPAAGEGGFLAAVAEAARRWPALHGQEINEAAWRIAKQRFLLRRIDADIRHGDSLLNDAFPDLRADAVLCDPPYGMTNPLSAETMTDSRWSFGFVNTRSADFVWLQHVIHHLVDEGRGYVLLPAGTLFRRGREADLRAEMIRRGAIDAIVSIPAGSAQHTAIPLALWIVRQPRVTAERPILLIDAAATETPEVRPTLDPSLIERIVEVVASWRINGGLKEEHRDFAAVVPVLELLGMDSNLVPSRWVHREALGDAGERRRVLDAAVERFAAARNALVHQPAEFMPPKASGNVNWIPVRELALSGVAELVRGARIKPEDCRGAGVRALRTRDIRDEIRDDDPCYVDLAQMKPRPVVTEPGDVIVSPASGKLRALVDEHGGHVLAYPLQGLRFRADWLDPHVAAAFLESPRNRRFATGTTYGYARVDLRELELPVLPLEEARLLREMLDQLSSTEREAGAMAASARELRETILGFAAIASDERLAL